MIKLNCYKTIARMALGVSLVALLSACSGGGTSSIDPGQPSADPTNSQGAGPEDFVPSMTLEFGFDDPTAGVNDEYIVEQWVYMQNCMQVSAVEPLVTVVEGKLTPLTSDDDVVRHIDGSIQASANVTDTGATIQVRADDFDGSLGNPGSYLRSIMGRYLWLANGFAERDYPYECATGS